MTAAKKSAVGLSFLTGGIASVRSSARATTDTATP